jgi:hypothetical protein
MGDSYDEEVALDFDRYSARMEALYSEDALPADWWEEFSAGHPDAEKALDVLSKFSAVRSEVLTHLRDLAWRVELPPVPRSEVRRLLKRARAVAHDLNRLVGKPGARNEELVEPGPHGERVLSSVLYTLEPRVLTDIVKPLGQYIDHLSQLFASSRRNPHLHRKQAIKEFTDYVDRRTKGRGHAAAATLVEFVSDGPRSAAAQRMAALRVRRSTGRKILKGPPRRRVSTRRRPVRRKDRPSALLTRGHQPLFCDWGDESSDAYFHARERY